MDQSNAHKQIAPRFTVAGISADPSALRLTSQVGVSQLEPMVMALLVALAERPNELWPRDELISHLWPNGFGSDESLTRLVSLLRKTLKSDHGQSNLVTTVPKLGYRLDATVSSATHGIENNVEEPSKLEPGIGIISPSKRSSLVSTVLVFVVCVIAISIWFVVSLNRPDRPDSDSLTLVPDRSAASLAVLPIEGLGVSEESGFLTDGMTRDLTALLARVPNLKVYAV